FSNTLEAVFITDINGKILRINKAFTDLTGYTEDEVIGKNANILKSTHHKKEFYENLWKTLLEKGYYQNEVWNRNKDGEIFVSIESISSIKHDNGDIKYFISSLHDITAKKDAEERVVHMAHFDPLTDLPNRVLFQDRFKHAIDIAKRNNNKLALAFIDIDGFKNVNDTKGHPIGDKLLVKISKIISNCIRDSDTISRLGGDEFTIIFENIESTDDIVYICKDILDNVSKEIIIDDMSIYVSASIGISVYPNDGEDIHILLQHADTAMYKSKDEGKNRISFYEKDMTEKANDKVLIETSLQTAIKNNEFLVHYQPKIDLETNKVIGAEALVRWISLGEGFIPPDKFIPIAEQMRIVDKIDLYVLETVCKDMSTWIDMGYRDIKVAVNLSGYDISVATLYEKIVAIVEKYGVSAKNIEFEITETYFANFSDDCLIKLNKLKDYGFTLSIDDFGTGYSSLSNLRKLPIDILKIDQSFIRTMNESSENQKFVDTIINFANILNLKTIAEGVETIYHFEYLKSKKCTFMQGYFESKPLPKSEFIEYLKNKQ
ncbi:MAG: EAL domain-containing protein, partial [Thiovulaceae bacterium]|nr:EAL domain-containing protein [Sulfurimonadaceae bacterium]